ncbi:uncharacterized protein JN550_001791 [Neoarthrinium moseri]|uniref:uncharacterized protein n=1 Tax=Neoarthrinium moseri TaxID=1658444 RepID=UPI001FDACC68|nr:uncharacterized protein JN550_001791 [Neoarthrinium moseri]KAI1876295.1 hypothetical protein JN550_001791 [Neoarthrinium moseri]
MFRFWGSDSRGSDKTVQIDRPMFDLGKPPVQPFVSETAVTTPSRSPKRRRTSNVAIASLTAAADSPVVKRLKLEDGSFPEVEVAMAGVEEQGAAQPEPEMVSMDGVKEVIEREFGQEILLKHQELRLINQELAKCQVALEQLRRCHLIPYPVNVPTPEQMLNISSGLGPALQAKMGAQVPQWAPPFGVTDGPYARHLAKWLIPDPKFDGIYPVPTHAEYTRSRALVDGRSTRNGANEVGSALSKGRRGREPPGQKLQALPSGYSQPKGKSGPCILKRIADGKTVKLVCVKCNREDFSSTQGFINHCRIAHKLEYKSHEEAAIGCGHPIDVSEAAPGIVSDERPAPPVVSHTPTSGPVHSYVDSESFFAAARRINETMAKYKKGELKGPIPGVKISSTPAATSAQRPSAFKPSAETPNLSLFAKLQDKGLDLEELVRDATTKVDLNEMFTPEDESEESEVDSVEAKVAQGDQASSAVAGMRMPAPARKPMSPIPPPILPISIRPTSSKGHTAPMAYATPVPTPAPRLSDRESECPLDDEMDIDLSPNTAVSNVAPSLVSDDDEYDDSVDGSCDESEVNDTLDTESMSDVAEIHLDDEGPRSLGHRGSTSAGADPLQLRKEDDKHVTFMTPVRDSPVPTTQAHGGLKRKNRI